MEAINLGGLRGPAAANATTLVVARPPLAMDFNDFLTIAEHIDDFIKEEGLRGVVQVWRTGAGEDGGGSGGSEVQTTVASILAFDDTSILFHSLFPAIDIIVAQ